MRYMGGKFRQSKAIAANVVPEYEGGAYVEPFVGAFGVAEKIIPALYEKGCREFRLSDKSAPIYDLWSAVFDRGWKPPDWVSEDEYAHFAKYRHTYIDDPMFAWCGHGASFGGKWFGGFARGGAKGQSSEKMQLSQKRAMLRKYNAVKPFWEHVSLLQQDYSSADVRPDDTVYCDPPYVDRQNPYSSKTGFDHALFWNWCRLKSQSANIYVTEFTVPPDTKLLYNWGDTVVRHNNGKPRDGTCEVLVKMEAQHG